MNLVHLLYCLLHLNKLIVRDFPRNPTMEQELIKYRLLNIFYNRDAEMSFLREMVEKEVVVIRRGDGGGWREYLQRLKEHRSLFRNFIYELELKRRRGRRGLERRRKLCRSPEQL